MCGIFFINDNAIVNLNPIAHRGPDKNTLIVSSNYQYGFCRLSIREVINGHQPTVTDEYVSAINGELYNESQIRSFISELNPTIQIPAGDMNVLGLYLYLTKGKGISAARGMFAGYIHFKKSDKLVFFRDSVGEKPLFQYRRGNQFALASENRFSEILSIPTAPITFGTFELVRGHSLWETEDVRECSPGTLYTLDLRTMCIEVFTYYAWPSRPRYRSQGTLDELESSIIDSIKLQSSSEFPISVMLSGGIDSSLIAFYAKHIGLDFSTFTLTMNDNQWDESRIARKFAEELGIEHSTIQYSDAEIASLIPKVLNSMDIPILDVACISLYLLTKEISHTNKVALSGDGGDEISRGYEIFNWTFLLNTVRNLIRLPEGFTSNFNFQSDRTKYNSLGMKLNRAKDVIAVRNFSIAEVALSPFGGTELLGKLARNETSKHLFVPTEEYYYRYILPRVYLAKSDRMSMANSVEVRAPFLDTRVIEEAMKLSKYFLYSHERKWILKELARRNLPPYLINRRKRGFSLPFGRIIEHLQEPEWQIDPRDLAGVSPASVWQRARRDQNYSMAAWALMVLNHFAINKKLIFLGGDDGVQ